MICIISDLPMGESKIKEYMASSKQEIVYFNAKDYRIEQCLGCEGCNKEKVLCVQKDDTIAIIPKVIKSDLVIIVTPIEYGSYSFLMKRIMDKFALTGSPYYGVRNKELYKKDIDHIYATPQRTYILGFKERIQEKEKQVFSHVCHELSILTGTQEEWSIIEKQEDVWKQIKQVLASC